MTNCAGITQAGTACRGVPIAGSQWCFSHHPDRAEERRRNGIKGNKIGGRGRPSVELKRIQHRLEELAELVLSGEVDRSDASVAGQLLHYSRACIRDVLAAREQEELVNRLERIEEVMGQEGTDAA